MPLFLSDEEYARYSHDPSLIAQKADAYIKELYNQLETQKAQYDAQSITAEQTCSLLEQKFVSLKSEFASLQSQHLQLNSTLEERVSELAQIQADKHQIYLQSIGKDGEIERLSLEASELQKSKSQLLQLIEHKDLEINEKNSSIKGYLDKIVALTDNAASKESRINELETDHARVHNSLALLTQEKELVERHNLWLNDELNSKVNSLLELRKVHNELEADMSSKLADLERKYNDTFSSLTWKDDRVKDLESKLEALQNELCSSKDMAAATEERLSAELATVNKLVELYKENSDEWSKKSGELEGVIKALETHASQVEKDFKERLDKETSTRIEFENKAVQLKEKLEQCEAKLENCRNADQINFLQMSSFSTKAYGNSTMDGDNGNNLMLVPSVPAGISGTALAASLLRDGWSLVTMYEKYHEAVDALRHEELGRKQSESVLERVLHELNENADVLMDERAKHERMVEAYDMLNEKLQHSVSEQTGLERTIQELKAELKRHEHDYNISQQENVDLQKQVTVLLKECRDIQLRCGSGNYDSAIEHMNVDSDGDSVFSDRLLTFKDINGLVEQNVQLRGLVRLLTEQIETKEAELKESFENKFRKHSNETASKVDAVLARAEEQAQMIESLHTSVAMYKKLYEEGHKQHLSLTQSPDTPPVARRNNVQLLLEDSNDASKRAQEKAYERVKLLEEELAGLRSEVITLRSQRDKLTLESTFAHDKLDRFMKDFDHQREQTNAIISRNVEFSQLIVDYQRKIREASESLHVSEDLSRKLNMEVSVLKREKEILVNSEKRAFEEIRSMSERLHQLQDTLNTIQSAEEVREETRNAHRMSQDDYVKRTEREWADAKKELQEERDSVRKLTLEHESAMRESMKRIEEMSKELANALHAVSDANSRASAAEERLSHFEKMKSTVVNDENGHASSSKDEMVGLKEEIEKLRVEAQSNKDHMLQYRSLAQVNETALLQMEESHEKFKSEAEKVKKSLEDEIASLNEQVNQLQDGYNSKVKEAAAAAEVQQEALASSLAEISKLREECTTKTLRIEGLESQMSAMKDNLEEEHKRWRTAQDNYERQVILQSETIQELTKTSQELAQIQAKASELEKLSEVLKIENGELKSKWETEKLVLEEAKNQAEKKYNEINEQNKLLHDQFEALHAKMGSGSEAQSSEDGGLQNVVKYLRRAKEIAETEISLLKQEKLRLQSQLESAVKAESAALGLLRVERENSRSVHFTEDEFKALQVQVREMNLLRESNAQLREENKNNFEECQKLRQFTHNAKSEVENLEKLLGERQNEVEGFKREIEMQKKERKDLEQRINELVEKFKDVDVEDYARIRVDVQQTNVKLLEKDGQLEEIKKLVSEKQDLITRLEQDLSRSKVEIDEREAKINSIVQMQASLKADVDRHKKYALQCKRKFDNMVKEKDEILKKNQELVKELADLNTKSNNVGTVGEQVEKDSKMLVLVSHLDRLRNELKKERDDAKLEKAKNQKNEKVISELQEKLRALDELEKQKQEPKTVSEEVEKTKNPPESDVPPPISGDNAFDDLAADTPLVATTSEVVTTVSTGQNIEEKAKLPVTSKPNVEPRKVARRLIRPPRNVKPEQPKADVEMSETEIVGVTLQPSLRKRPSVSSEGQEGSHSSADVAVPLVKKSRGLEQRQDHIDVSELVPSVTEENDEDENQTLKDEELETGDELAVEDQAEIQNDEEHVIMQTETEVPEDPPKVTEAKHGKMLQVTGEGGDEPEEGEMVSDSVIGQETAEAQFVEQLIRSPSPVPIEEEMTEDILGEMDTGSPRLTMEENEDKNEEGEIEVEETTPESSTDKQNNDGNDEAGTIVDEAAIDTVVPLPVVEKPSNTSATVETSTVNNVGSVSTSGPTEVKQEETVVDTGSTTFNWKEKAKERAKERMAGTPATPPVAVAPPVAATPPVPRGRARLLRGRPRGGRTGRGGQAPGSQGM